MQWSAVLRRLFVKASDARDSLHECRWDAICTVSNTVHDSICGAI
eukprot:SAG31_NODE_38036_length_299_cov_1.035000_1_plen_44_part_10